MQAFVYLNGDIIPYPQATLHISDLGLLRGYGIFDFFRAIDGQPVFLEDHLDRLENSVRLMHLPLLQTRDALREAILEVIRLNAHELLGVKVVITGGYSPDGYEPDKEPNVIIFGKPFRFSDSHVGLRWMGVEYQREIPEIKTTNYVVPIRHLPAMHQGGFHDVLYHRDGLVSESSRSNIFIIKNEKIITPVTGILYGVTRKHALQMAQQHFEVEEREVTLQEVFEADEVFTTASTKRIAAVTQVDGHVFGDGKPGRITHKLQELFLEYEGGIKALI